QLLSVSPRAEMERVSQVLQLPVVIKRSRPLFFEPQPLQKLDFLVGSIIAERAILEELLKARLYDERLLRFALDELKSLQVPQSQSAVENNFHPEGLEINVPGFNQRIEKRHKVFNRHFEDIRIQELENGDPHVFVASVAH